MRCRVKNGGKLYSRGKWNVGLVSFGGRVVEGAMEGASVVLEGVMEGG